jgi:ABC-type Fe3+ transport system permease subunit
MSATDMEDAKAGRPLNFGQRVGCVLLAGVSSTFLVGLGQVYTRRWWRALGYFVGTFVLWFVLLGWVLHIASAFDAMITAGLETGKPNASLDSRWGTTWTTIFVAINAAFLGIAAYLAFQHFDKIVSAANL